MFPRCVPSLVRRADSLRCSLTTKHRPPKVRASEISITEDSESGHLDFYMQRLVKEETEEEDPHFRRQQELMQQGMQVAQAHRKPSKSKTSDPDPGPDDWLKAFMPWAHAGACKPGPGPHGPKRPAPTRRTKTPRPPDVQRMMADALKDSLGPDVLAALGRDLRGPSP